MPTFSDSKPTSKLEINSPKLKLIDLFTNKYILFTYNSGGQKVSDRRIGLKKKSFGLTNNNPFVRKPIELMEKNIYSRNNANISRYNANVSRFNANISRNNANSSRYNANISHNNANISRNNANISRNNANVSRNNANISRYNANVSRNNANFPHYNANLFVSHIWN